MINTPSSTEELRDDVLRIRADLRAGNISNTVARTLLNGAKIALDTLRAEMEATRLGAIFNDVHMTEKVRNKQASTLRRVA